MSPPEKRPRGRSLAWETIGYMTGQTGILLFGLISFPLFTRRLTPADYGLFSLVNNTLAFAVVALNLGLPNAVVRFLPEYQKRGDQAGERTFRSTQLTAAAAAGLVGALLVLLVCAAAPVDWSFYSLARALRYAALLLVVRSAANVLLEFFRMARRTLAYNALAMSQRASNFAGAVAGYFWTRSLTGVLVGMTAAETAITVAAALVAMRQGLWRPALPGFSILGSSLRFSLPLMIVSVCSSIMAYTDRYVLLAWSDRETVARYAVAYDMCLLLQTLLVAGFRLSAMPETVRRYTQEGEQAAIDFLRDSFRHFGWLLVAAGFGMIAVRRELIVLLASSRYADSAELVPWIIPGILLGSVNFMFGVAFHLKKRTGVGLAVTALSALLSVGLYLALVPSMLAKGGALATLGTYLFLCAATAIAARRLLPVRFDLGSLARALACGGLMCFAVGLIGNARNPLVALAVKIPAGMALYGLALLAVDPHARRAAGKLLGDRFWRFRWYQARWRILRAWYRARFVPPAPAMRPFLTPVEPGAAYAAEHPEWLAELLAQAEEAASGTILLQGEPTRIDTVECWRRHPVNGRVLPTYLHPFDWSLAAGTAGSDLVPVLELHALPFLPALAQACRLTGNPACLERLLRSLDLLERAQWPPVSVSWDDALHLALRAISVAYASSLLGDAAPASVAAALRRIAASSGELLERAVDRISFNHRIGEAFGLFCCGLAFQGSPRGRAWIARAGDVLDEELRRQFWAEGVHVERSPDYLRFVLEVLLAYRLLAARRGLPLAEDFDNRLRAGCAALATLAPGGAPLPGFGDQSRLSIHGDPTVSTCLALSAVLWPDHAFKSAGLPFTPAAYWLTGDDGYRKFQAAPAAAPPAEGFELREAGFYVLANPRSSLWLTAGREGTPRQGHSHSDLLSFELRVGADRPLVDGGTFRYLEQPWRDYFRSARAHNTLMVDGQEHGVPANGDHFGWSHYPAPRLVAREYHQHADLLTLEHDGYQRLPHPVTHRRHVLAIQPDYWVLADDLLGEGEHLCELYFLFAPGPVLLAAPNHCRAGRSWGNLDLWTFGADTVADLACGQNDPPRGWVSPAYGERQPAFSLRVSRRGPAPLRLLTVLIPQHSRILEVAFPAGGPPGTLVVTGEGVSDSIRIGGPGDSNFQVSRLQPGGEEVSLRLA